MFSRNLFFFFVSAQLSVNFVFAQNDEQPVVAVEMQMLGWSDEGIEGISFLDGASFTEVAIPAWQRSEPYRYSGPATLNFFLNKNKEAGPVCSVVFKPGVKRYTILVLTQGSEYRALAMPDDPEYSPVGKARIINFTSQRIALKANGENLALLNPREEAIAEPNTENNLLKVRMAYEEDGEWQRAGIQRFIIAPWQQTTLFFVTSKADFFKTGDGATKEGPQPFVLQKAAPLADDTDNFFKTGTGESREGPQRVILTQ